MKILAIEQDMPGVAEEAFTDDILENEAMRLWELHLAGSVREMYFRADRHSAVLVLECESAHEARILLSTLPLVKHRIIDFEIIPLVSYDGFARLFTKQS